MDLFPIFQAIEASAIGQGIKTSPWAFPVIEATHLVALATLGGAVLLVDMRMLGMGLRKQSIASLARETQALLVGSWALMIATGLGLFVSESIKCYYSTPFRVKMAALLIATVYTFTLRRKVVLADATSVRPATYRLVALVSLALWFSVGASGRWVGFSG
jgi:hypothetical protein